ncbi:hypothetical protein, partial [Corallococcus exiguus]|uniref:hypothetical protein n=1 Tax=Corallococcus exiguus TaxID=83462 RepID=UPI001C12DF1E
SDTSACHLKAAGRASLVDGAQSAASRRSSWHVESATCTSVNSSSSAPQLVEGLVLADGLSYGTDGPALHLAHQLPEGVAETLEEGAGRQLLPGERAASRMSSADTSARNPSATFVLGVLFFISTKCSWHPVPANLSARLPLCL